MRFHMGERFDQTSIPHRGGDYRRATLQLCRTGNAHIGFGQTSIWIIQLDY